MMNDIISLKTNRLQIKTLSTIQKVKYDLKASNQTPVQKYRRINFLRSPVDQNFVAKLRHLGKHMKIDSKKPNKKRNDIMRKWVLAQSQKRKEFHQMKRHQKESF